MDHSCYFVGMEAPPPSPPHEKPPREAKEVFISMHRYFRVSRNIRAHWFFDHLNRTVAIEKTPSDDEYSREMVVVGIIPKIGEPNEIVGDERFKVCLDTKITYISRFYRHVFILDLSPSSIVADEETNCCLHTKLLECLRLSMSSVAKSFTIPGTQELFNPQIYISVIVFIPFLGFEEDLVLVHGVLLTSSNIEDVLDTVTERFNKLVLSLYQYSKPIIKKWGHLRRRHRSKYDSTCETESMTDRESRYSYHAYADHDSSDNRSGNDYGYVANRANGQPKQHHASRILDFKRKLWEQAESDAISSEQLDAKCDGYIFPEWAIIFMLRLGLIAVQTLPENTQSNVIVITDAVAGMPDAQALQELLNQIRSYTVSCSFIQIQGRSRSEACFGHVSSAELFHFMAMATFGAYIPNCKCSIGVDMDCPSPLMPDGDFQLINSFHRALLCWCFQNALQDNVHITNLVREINPGFAELYKSDTIRHRAFNRTYISTLHEILYVRLREGFTLKSVELLTMQNRIKIHLCMPFRPLVFLEYAINAPWPADRQNRDLIYVDLVVQCPYNEIKDFKSHMSGNLTGANPDRMKLLTALRNTLESIENADVLLIHIHSFNTNKAYYSLPTGANEFAIYHLEDSAEDSKRYPVENISRSPRSQDDFGMFLKFWEKLCSMNEGIWQKWVHMHFERVILRSDELPWTVFTGNTVQISCEEAKDALHKLLNEESSFCLIRRQLYVTFARKPNVDVPLYFYMIRVCQEPPCVVLKAAFLGGISSTERRKVVDHLRNKLTDLKITNSKTKKPVEALYRIRRPLERILICYEQVPLDLRTVVRISAHEKGDVRDLTMHNAVSKYLQCRRRIWRLVPLSLGYCAIDEKSAEYILMIVLRRRREEHYNVAWSKNGIVGLCRQVYVHGPVLEQYIIFPPTVPHVALTAHQTNASYSSLRSESRFRQHNTMEQVLITEMWKEPSVGDEKVGELPGPSPESDDELVSLLFTMDQLLRFCDSSMPGQMKFSLPNKTNQPVLTFSGCVTVVDQSFNLANLVKNSNRVLLNVPIFNTVDDKKFETIKITLEAIHREMETAYNVCLEGDDQNLFQTILTDIETAQKAHAKVKKPPPPEVISEGCEIAVEPEVETTEQVVDRSNTSSPVKFFSNCPCRIYLRRLSTWIVSVTFVPTSADAVAATGKDVLPLVVAVCDEAQLAYGLIKREKLGYVDEYKFSNENPSAIPTFNHKRLSIPLEYISAVRCAPMLRTNYTPVPVESVVRHLHSQVIERALISSLYVCVRNGFPLDDNEIRVILEEHCDYNVMEIEAVSGALEAFCSHMHETSRSNIHSYCTEESNLEKLFTEVLGKNFREIPNLKDYFYFSSPRGEDGYSLSMSESCADVVKKNMPFEGPDSRRDSLLNERRSSGERTPDDDCSSTVSVNRVVKTSAEVLETKLQDTKRMWKRADKKMDKISKRNKKQDDPLFLCFNCDVHFPDGSVENFPISFLPSCVYQVLECTTKKGQDIDVSKVRVRLMIYIMTWPRRRTLSFTGLSSESEEEDCEVSQRSERFMSKLSTRERAAIKRLIASMNRLIELESVLVDSRKRTVKLENVLRISKFISKECSNGGESGRMEERSRPLVLVRQSPEIRTRLMNRLNGMNVNYCKLKRCGNSNVYYCCQVEDMEAFGKSAHSLSARNSAEMEEEDRDEDLSASALQSRSSRYSVQTDLMTTSNDSTLNVPKTRANRANSYESCQRTTEPSAEFLDELMVRRDIIYDFWVILTVDQKITLQFCQRYESQHAGICDAAWRTCRQTIRQLNQELLLEQMLETSECDPLLLSPENDAHVEPYVRSLSFEKEDFGPVDQTFHPDRTAFPPGYFACPLVQHLWFDVHTRLKTCSSEYEISRIAFKMSAKGHDEPLRFQSFYDRHCNVQIAIDLIRTALDSLRVKNIPNTYVIKDERGNIMYMHIYTLFDKFRNDLKANRLTLSKREFAEIDMHLREEHIMLAVYGIDTPGQELNVLKDTLQGKLDSSTLDCLINLLMKNNMARLESDDVTFIQRSPSNPTACFYFPIPSELYGFLSAIDFYIKQHIQVHMTPARYKEDSFLPYPSGTLPANYEPVFYLFVKSIQTGVRTKGIACLEFRIIESDRTLAEKTHGLLRELSREQLVKNFDEPHLRLRAFQNSVSTECVLDPTARIDSKFVQVIIWQAGDVGLEELQQNLQYVVEMSFCDVVMEYGILNLNVLESSCSTISSVFDQPPQSPLPANLSKSHQLSQKASPVSSDRRPILKKRDSSESMLNNTSIVLPVTPTHHDKKTAMFTFESVGKRASIASDIGATLSESSRQSFHVNPKLVSNATAWLDFTSFKYPDESISSFTKYVCEFDNSYTLRGALQEICEKIDQGLKASETPLVDKVSLCELTETAGVTRYEVISKDARIFLEEDIAFEDVHNPTDKPDFILIAMSKDVAEETQRFGYEHARSEPPEALKILASGQSLKDNFVPQLNPFIPRQRLLYGVVKGQVLTVYFYNFSQSKAKELKSYMHKCSFWHIARTRFMRETSLHKLGITNLSPYEGYYQNTYLCLVWRNPDDLLDSDYPPDEIDILAIDGMPQGWAQILFRLFRRADFDFIRFCQQPCLVSAQLEQGRAVRQTVMQSLVTARSLNLLHDRLLHNQNNIQEADLNLLMRNSRRVHFVQSPVLLFPKWRRKIAEVRGQFGSYEPRKATLPPLASSSRHRSHTLTVHPSPQQHPLRFRSEDDDPCEVKVLYMLMNDYIAYLKSIGFKLFNVQNLGKKSTTKCAYNGSYPAGCRYAPLNCLFKEAEGGIIVLKLYFNKPYFVLSMYVWHVDDTVLNSRKLKENEYLHYLQELEHLKNLMLSQCHLHSFTYDFHLRILSKYLVEKRKEDVIFNPGYNTYLFLVDFLKYYGCRPPNARNCVYEERYTFDLLHEIQASHIWTHFLDMHHEKVYGWRVVRLKNTDDDSTTPQGGDDSTAHDYMLVSSEEAVGPNGHEKTRVLLRDRRKPEVNGKLFLVQYLVLVDPVKRPMEDEKYTDSLNHTEVGEFLNVEKPTEAMKEAEIDNLLQNVNRGFLPNVDGTVRKRRFSSGPSTTGIPTVKSLGTIGESDDKTSPSRRPKEDSDSETANRLSIDGSSSRRHRKSVEGEDGEIPGEQVTYVQFLCTKQRELQNHLEKAVAEYSEMLKKTVSDAESQCRRMQMWDKVVALPTNKSQSTSGIKAVFSTQPAEGEWSGIQSYTLDVTPLELDILMSLVYEFDMTTREKRLQPLLQGTSCARLCRFLYCRYGARRCRFFEYADGMKSLLITNPNNLDSLFKITCTTDTTPVLSVLLKDKNVLTEDKDNFKLNLLDQAFDELVQCVTAFLWADLLQKPPGKA